MGNILFDMAQADKKATEIREKLRIVLQEIYDTCDTGSKQTAVLTARMFDVSLKL